MARTAKAKKRNKGLLAIAIFKFIKGTALLFVTLSALNLLHKNLAAEVTRWIDMVRIDPDNQYIAAVLEKLRFIHTQELKELSALTFFYAALFLTEGVGLALEKFWAEWLTIIATGLFIPVEICELCHEPTWMKAALLLINILIVAFLIFLARNRTRRR